MLMFCSLFRVDHSDNGSRSVLEPPFVLSLSSGNNLKPPPFPLFLSVSLKFHLPAPRSAVWSLR